MWLADDGGERRVLRLCSAFAISTLCHVCLLAALRGWGLESRSPPPLMVTMLERGGGEGARGGNAGTAGPDAGAPVAAAVAALPRAAVPALPHAAAKPIAPPRVAERRNVERRSVLPLPAAAPPQPALAEPAPPVDAPTDGAAVASSNGAATATADDGGSGGGHGNGHGNGSGSGGDGLRAFCASCPAPDYPARARRQGWQGTVDVDLVIGRDGEVEEARVDHSSGVPTLDAVALEVARASRFAIPRGGDGLRGQLRYRFVLDATADRR
jgi:protein TonB